MLTQRTFFFLRSHHMACGILVPRPRTEPEPTAVKAPSPGLPGNSQQRTFFFLRVTFSKRIFKNLVTMAALFYIFANFINVRLNEREWGLRPQLLSLCDHSEKRNRTSKSTEKTE